MSGPAHRNRTLHRLVVLGSMLALAASGVATAAAYEPARQRTRRSPQPCSMATTWRRWSRPSPATRTGWSELW